MFNNQPNKNNIIAFHGPINIDFVSYSANYLRSLLGENFGSSKKMFKIFIELTQNVSYYSAHVRSKSNKQGTRRGVGWFSVDEYDKHYTISTGNLIDKSHSEVLEKNCFEINALNEHELRDLKRKTRSQASIKDIGAHIGLIHTGLLSGNPLDINITPVDDIYAFFRLEVKIDKKNN